MNTLPKVVGIVPAYKSENGIRATLEALSRQDYPNLEVIICDDCSPDHTYQVCEAFAKDHPNFMVIRNETNLGWISNSEKLWKLALQKGTYCFLNPHDDHPFPRFVSRQVEVLERNPAAVLAIPGMENSYSDGTIILSHYADPVGKKEVTDRVYSLIERTTFWWAAYHGLHRSSAVREILPASKLRFGEKEFFADSIWLIRLSMLGEFEQVPDVLFTKNYDNRTLHQSWDYGKINTAGYWVAVLETIGKSPLNPRQKAFLRNKIVKLLLHKLYQRFQNLLKK